MLLILKIPNSTRGHRDGTEAPGRWDSVIHRCLDGGERLLILALYGWLATRLIAEWHQENLILLASEGVVIVFVLVRRTAVAISRRPVDWLIAGVATSVPLLAMPGVADEGASPLTSWVCLMLLILGLLIQLYAKLTLGQGFGCVPAHRGLTLDGPYRVVRHPMYSGYLMGHVGYLAMNPSAWNASVYIACYACQIPRLIAEERLLAGDPAYLAYRAEVPSRLIPGIF